MKLFVVTYLDSNDSDTGHSTYYKTNLVGVFTSYTEAEQAVQQVIHRNDIYPRIKEVESGVVTL